MQGLGESFSVAYGVSADGLVVVGSGAGAVRWTSSEGVQSLGNLPGGSPVGMAFDTSADGSVIVGRIGRSNGTDGDEAFVWTKETQMRSLSGILEQQGDDLSNWTSLDEAFAVSADGRTVVGAGTNSSGNREAFVATISVAPVLLGDINSDNAVNFLDIQPFISILSAGDFQAEADFDESGDVNFLDITPFIAILSVL